MELGDGFIKRTFSPFSITVSGIPTKFSPDEIKQFFENEKFWLKELESEWLPKTLEIGDDFVIQEYTQPALIEQMPRLPDIKDQLIEMYRFFKQKNVFKRNGSVSNLTMRNNQLVAFDFKWAKERPIGLEMELKSYDEWLSKIDSSLKEELRALI